MKTAISFFVFMLFAALIAAGCTAAKADGLPPLQSDDAARHEFTLRTAMVDGRMAFVGVGGAINDQINPTMTVTAGDGVHIILQNGDGMAHDLLIPELHVRTKTVVSRNSTADVTFTPASPGVYSYYCTVSGHRQAGMEGTLVVTPAGS